MLNFNKEIKMKKILPCCILLCCIITKPTLAEQVKEVALTIDDLPFVGTNSNDPGNLRRTQKRFLDILHTLNENHIPTTGFVIANSIAKGQWELLEEFRNNGYEIGNHTYSHANLNYVPANKYIENIEKADKILQPIMTQPKYFRYPGLTEGKGEKKQIVQDYLTSNQYVIAPVTIDSKDYKFNARLLNINWRVRAQYLNKIKQQYLAYIWNQTQKAERKSKNGGRQILLIHANLLNSHCLGDVIKMYKDHGYKFITLQEALANPAVNQEQETTTSQENEQLNTAQTKIN